MGAGPATATRATTAYGDIQAREAVHTQDDERAHTVLSSPLAFADPELEGDFFKWQKKSYSSSATFWVLFQIAMTVVTGVRMVALGKANRRVYALVTGSIAFWLGSLHVLQQLPSMQTRAAWLVVDMCLRAQFYVWGVVVRPPSPLTPPFSLPLFPSLPPSRPPSPPPFPLPFPLSGAMTDTPAFLH